MGYRFCFGASGSGKSTALHRAVIERAAREPDIDFILLVPEQFTMQTQKDLVLESPQHGIMNIDVLSFGRLGHRIFREIGADSRQVLGDMGKILILRRIAASCRDRLQVLNRTIGRPGMIDEVKSCLSEFMQYGIGDRELTDMVRYAGESGRGALKARLEDLQILYEEFQKFKENKFITGEETMDLLAQAVPHSRALRGSVVILDGFTGFTPLQYRVLSALIRQAADVVISLTYAPDGGPSPKDVERTGSAGDEHALFYLTRKTVRDLSRIASEDGLARGQDLYMEEKQNRRFSANPVLRHLEAGLFRYPVKVYAGETGPALTVSEMTSPSEEVRQICIAIRRLILEKGYCYRDIGVVTGDLPTYGELFAQAAAEYDIPVYIDQTSRVTQNPLTEGICSALEIPAESFSYQSVFRYLRSGMSGLSDEETDLLENYCLAHGINSRKRWLQPFDAGTEALRQKFLLEISPITGNLMEEQKERELHPDKKERPSSRRRTAGERTRALYDFMVRAQFQQKADEYTAYFHDKGDQVREKEYSQIYRAVIDLLDQIYDLLGDEMISAKDYLELLQAGFDEMRLGTLPQKVDRVLCGDMERTRMTQVRVLFFAGVNDGNIPSGVSEGGILSDLDREFLAAGGLELAPTPRQQMFTQRLYLYLNMTKPTDALRVSFSKISAEGRSMRPSYLIRTLLQMYPSLQVRYPQQGPVPDQITGTEDAMTLLSGQLRNYADGYFDEDPKQKETFVTLYGTLADGRSDRLVRVRRLRDAAFRHYVPERITGKAAEALYGRTIYGSISRMETAAQCYLRQFLQYGLRLQQRDEFTFEPADTGNVLHQSLQLFGHKLKEQNISWTQFTPQQGQKLIEEALSETVSQYRNLILYSNARNSYLVRRLERTLDQTVDTLQYQLKKGKFTPRAEELQFGGRGGDTITYGLSRDRKLMLTGKIDRLDLCDDGDSLYIKILDYKSGRRDLDPDQMLRGLQLQLIIYMETMLKLEGKLHPDQTIVPAAMLYFHMDNPVIRITGTDDAGDVRQKIRRQMRTTGMVDLDGKSVELLDSGLTGESDVIPVKINRGGGYSKNSRGYTRRQFEELFASVRQVICQMAEEILDGNVSALPARIDAARTACDFCPFRNVCGFDPKVPGYRFRK